jgi:SAM-dependent methyltransferase
MSINTITGIDRFNWILQHCKIGEKIIDIGSQDGHTFRETPFSGYVTSVDLDIYDFPGFVQMDACDLKFSDKEFDVAILGEILEHVENPVQVIKEANRVAKRVLMTIPNEYEWDKSLFPFEKIEEGMKRRNLTLEEIVRVSNPSAKEFYDKDDHKHMFHNRYYEEDSLRKDLESAGIIDYKMNKLQYGQPQWSFFVVNTGIDIGNDVKDAIWKDVSTNIDTIGMNEIGSNVTYGTDINVARVLSSNGKLRIALISTPFFTIPPKGYSGLEMVLWDLAEG